jgi:5-methyltetrahydrofolate--homocysteine methyltransferase
MLRHTPEHIRQLVEAIGPQRPVKQRTPQVINAVASLYSDVALKQDTSYLAIGERTNANGSKAFREAMLAGNWDECVQIGRDQSRSGAHVVDLCVDYVGRDGAEDMVELASRFAGAVTLPVMLELDRARRDRSRSQSSSGPGHHQLGQLRRRRRPNSRFQRVMPLVKEHGAAVVALTIDEQGQARTTEWKVQVAERLIATLTNDWASMRATSLSTASPSPSPPSGGDPARRTGHHRGNPPAQGRASEGGDHARGFQCQLRPEPGSARGAEQRLLDECVKAGLDSAIVSVAKIMPTDRIRMSGIRPHST